MKRLLLLFGLILGFQALWSQDLPSVYPNPQKVVLQGGLMDLKPGKTRWQLGKGVDDMIVARLKELLDGQAIRVVAGVSTDGKFKKLAVPEVPEGYFLQLTPGQITLVGRDDAGLFYALQSLQQLVVREGQLVKLPVVTITDWPDVRFRGTVEGFYGKPWGHTDRLSQLAFYGTYKLNTYIYGPKDDPFHGFSTRWREPYPNDKAAQIKELVQVANQNRVNFIWAIHPGRDIAWTDQDGDGIIDDFAACLHKFELMYALGVRSFAVFFDDISGEGTNAIRQAEMLNYLNANFVRKKNDVTPLIMCPTQYNKAWSGGDYLDILGDNLDRDIAIMWTGNSVCADITREGMDWINARIKREAFIWWNWPVTDYVRTRLLLGRTYGLDPLNKGTMSGFTANPMDKPEASKIGLFGVADYTWNMAAFDSHQSWRDGIRRLFPTLHQAMQVFADHNSDQGKNTHGYRREESVDIAPAIAIAAEELNNNGTISAANRQALVDEFEAIRHSGETLKRELPKVNPAMFEEVEYWLFSFESLGKAGQALLQLLDAESGSIGQKMALCNTILAHLNEMETFSRLQKEKGAPDRWAKGCEVGATVVTPFVKTEFTSRFKHLYSTVTDSQKDAVVSDAVLYKPITNMPALANVQVQRNGQFVTIAPMLEVITLQSGDYFGILLPQGICANYVHARLDNSEVSEKGTVQVSSDGVTWRDMAVSKNGNELQGRLNLDDQIRWVRFINQSAEKLELKIELFKVDVPGDARINDQSAMFDGDPFSAYLLQVDKTPLLLDAPDNKGANGVYVLGDVDAVTLELGDGSEVRYTEISQFNGVAVKAIKIERGAKPVNIHEIIWL